MLIPPGVDIPEPLLQAQQDGTLVIFAGAGVSVDAPSALPLFGELTRQIGILVDHPATKQDLKYPDRFLGVLAGKRNIHSLAANLIAKEGSEPNALHHAILRASAAGGSSLRLVTTNYDLHFSNAARIEQMEVPAFDAPALPMGDDFDGIVHLHGSLRQDSRHLVLTDVDFGHAYLTDAWAAQFLRRMFNRYTVLFIGYSHSDVVMDYLARGLSSDSKARYALTPENEIEKWRRLEVIPVAYPLKRRGSARHSALKSVIEEWASLTNMGLLDHRKRISELVNGPPPDDPIEADYLATLFNSPSKTEFFTEFARGELWLSWAEKQPIFKEIFTNSHSGQIEALSRWAEYSRGELPLSWVDKQARFKEIFTNPYSSQIETLSRWFVQYFVVVESNSQRALKTIQSIGGRLGQVLWHEIALGFHRSDEISSDLFRPWIVLLIESAPLNTSSLLDYMMIKCRWPEDRSSALLLLDYLLSPRIDLQPTYQFWGDDTNSNQRLVRPDLSLRGSDYWLPENWENIFRPHLNEIASDTARISTQKLFQAHSLMTAFSAANRVWDPLSFARSAIEPHDQNQYREATSVLVDVARDSVLHLLANDVEAGSGYVTQWAQAEAPILRRLAVHAWKSRTDKTSNEKISWVLSKGRIFDVAAKHEVFDLIQDSLASCSLDIRCKLVDAVISGVSETEERDYEIFNFLVWILRADPELTQASDALAQLQSDHPEFEPRAHPDLGHWFTQGTPASTFSMTIDELHNGICNNPQVALEKVLTFFDPERAGHSGWQDALERVSGVVAQWPDDGHKILSMSDVQSQEAPGLWRAVVNGWESASLNDDQWSNIISTLVTRPTGQVVSSAVCRLLERGSENVEFGIPLELMEAARGLAKSMWREELDGDVGDLSNFGWYGFAINSSAGSIAQFWIHSISREWRAAGDQWSGVAEHVAQELASMIVDRRSHGAAFRAIFGARLSFMFGADQEWCKSNLLRLFKWDSDTPEFTRQVWDGYLRVGRWNEPLLQAGFREYLVNTAPRVETDLPTLRNRLCEHLATIALYSDVNPLSGDWLVHIISSSSPSTRHSWARRVREILSSNTRELAERRWTEWIEPYWEQRTRGIPAFLDADEASAMASWTPYLGEGFPRAVELCKTAAAPVKHEDLLIHGLLKTGMLSAYPVEVSSLLTHLLKNTPEGGELDFQLQECVVVLRQSSSAGTLRPLIEAAMRAGYQRAASWIDIG